MNLLKSIRKLAAYRWTVRSAVAWAGAIICLAIAIAGAIAASGTGAATILSIPAGQFMAVLVVPAALACLVLVSGAVRDGLARNNDASRRR